MHGYLYLCGQQPLVRLSPIRPQQVPATKCRFFCHYPPPFPTHLHACVGLKCFCMALSHCQEPQAYQPLLSLQIGDAVLHQFSVIHVRCFYCYQSDHQTNPTHLTAVNLLLFSRSFYVQGGFFWCVPVQSLPLVPPLPLLLWFRQWQVHQCLSYRNSPRQTSVPHRMGSCRNQVHFLPPPVNPSHHCRTLWGMGVWHRPSLQSWLLHTRQICVHLSPNGKQPSPYQWQVFQGLCPCSFDRATSCAYAHGVLHSVHR